MHKVSRSEYIQNVMLLRPEELLRRFELGMQEAGQPTFDADQAAEFIGIITDFDARMSLALWLLEGAEAAGVIE